MTVKGRYPRCNHDWLTSGTLPDKCIEQWEHFLYSDTVIILCQDSLLVSPVELRIEKESKEAVAWLVPLSQRNTNTKTKMMPTGYYYSRTASVCLLKMSLILLEKSNIFFEHYILSLGVGCTNSSSLSVVLIWSLFYSLLNLLQVGCGDLAKPRLYHLLS